MLNQIIVINLLVLLVKVVAFRSQDAWSSIGYSRRDQVVLNMKKGSQPNKTLRTVLIAASLLPLIANAQPQPLVKTMDAAVSRLEQSQDRETTLQAMDELYTISESKSSIVKAKFKYVRHKELNFTCN